MSGVTQRARHRVTEFLGKSKPAMGFVFVGRNKTLHPFLWASRTAPAELLY